MKNKEVEKLREINEELGNENLRLQEDLEDLKEQIELKNKYLQLITDLGYDYDGLNIVEDLKYLIDDLVVFARMGIDNKDIDKIKYKGE